MKIQSLLFTLLFFLGTTQMSAQLPQKPHGGTNNGACVKITNVKQECTEYGVNMTFYLWNQSGVDAEFITITDGNGWSESVAITFPNNTVGITQFTYTGAQPASVVCFTIKLYNFKKELCCYAKQCIKTIGCPCAYTDKELITCKPGANPGTYIYRIRVINPSYSTTTINQVIISSSTPGLCLDGSPLPLLISPITAIPPGTSDLLFFELTSCSGTLGAGVDIDLTFFFENTYIPEYCCHIDAATVTTPCCHGKLTCSDFEMQVSAGTSDPEQFLVLSGISNVSATLDFVFTTANNPDQLVVRINGITVLNSGPWSSDGVPGGPCSQPAQGPYTGQVTVKPCDTIRIGVLGNVSNCGSVLWDLDIMCDAGFGPNGDGDISALRRIPFSNGNGAKALGSDMDYRITQSQTALSIFPNPVKDILNIRNSESNYTSINVMDGSGRIILRSDMSGKTDLQLDTSVLPEGTYLIEITDDTGHKTLERFIKIN